MTTNQSDFLTPETVASHYPGLTPRWLARRRWEHRPPAYVKAGKRVLYRRSDLEAYLNDATMRFDDGVA